MGSAVSSDERLAKYDFTGKVVLVSGSARGQGAEHIRAFHRAGAQVVIADILEDAGRALAAELGPRALYRHLDVTSGAAWDRAIAGARDVFGPVGVLVNNAGIARRGSLVDGDPELFRQVMDVNVMGAVHGIRAVAESMRELRGGAIVNISSMVGLLGRPESSGYTTSNWALRGLTKCAAVDFAPFGVRVNAILPGLIDTPMVITEQQNYDEVFDRHEAHFLVPRLGRPADVAQAVMFLASTRASYITGAEFLVDGGWTVS